MNKRGLRKSSLPLIVFVLLLSACKPPAGEAGVANPEFFNFVAQTVQFLLMAALTYYLLVTRPKDLEEEEHYRFLKGAEKGDAVVLKSGILGKVQSVAEDAVTVEIAQNVKVRVQPKSVKPVDPEKYKKVSKDEQKDNSKKESKTKGKKKAESKSKKGKNSK